MTDILGPNGQPVNPSPFEQGKQNIASSISIDTTQAQRAFDNLQKTLDGIMKSFGGTWESTTKDRLAAEERFYRAVGDKAKARQAELMRHKNDLLGKIQEEAQVQISVYEKEIQAGKRSQDDLLKYKKDVAAKTLQIEKETQAQIRQGAGFHGAVEKATAFAGGVGGPIGSTVAGLGNLLTNPLTAVTTALLYTFEKVAMTRAAFAKTGSGLAGAGFALGTGTATAETFTGRAFGALPIGSLSQEQQRQIIGTMTGSRTLIDQTKTGRGADAFGQNLGLYANILPDVAEETKLFTEASKDLGMTQEDISKTFISSRVNAERLKITQLDAIRTQLEMQKALRNITNDGAVASSVLSNMSEYLNKIGASEAEKIRIGGAVAQAGANLSLSQIAGMFAFTHGGQLPNPQQMFGANGAVGGGTFQLMGEFLTKVGNQFRDPTQRMFAAGQLQQQFLPGLRLQDIPKFFDLTNAMMKGSVSNADFERQFKGLEKKTPQIAAAEGIERLGDIVDPIQKLENVFSNFWTQLDQLLQKYFGSSVVNTPYTAEKMVPTRKNIQRANIT